MPKPSQVLPCEPMFEAFGEPTKSARRRPSSVSLGIYKGDLSDGRLAEKTSSCKGGEGVTAERTFGSPPKAEKGRRMGRWRWWGVR